LAGDRQLAQIRAIQFESRDVFVLLLSSGT